MCGEKEKQDYTYNEDKGSPPRVRGKGASLSSAYLPTGITPACAGKSRIDIRHKFSNKDHPRVCGEKKLPGVIEAIVAGSPPRVRGKD